MVVAVATAVVVEVLVQAAEGVSGQDPEHWGIDEAYTSLHFIVIRRARRYLEVVSSDEATSILSQHPLMPGSLTLVLSSCQPSPL